MLESRISLIIPTYNEATRINSVIEAGLASKSIERVIVVDDGSTDNLAENVRCYGYNISFVRHEVNKGKGEAMQSGYEIAKCLGSTGLLFLDADLRGITSSHVDSLVSPVINEEVPMTIGILDRTQIQKMVLKKWGALSGQRAMTMDIWEQLTEQGRSGFNVEAALNVTARHQGWHRNIRRIELNGVYHMGQREKQPNLISASTAYIRRYGSAVITYVDMELSHNLNSR